MTLEGIFKSLWDGITDSLGQSISAKTFGIIFIPTVEQLWASKMVSLRTQGRTSDQKLAVKISGKEK